MNYKITFEKQRKPKLSQITVQPLKSFLWIGVLYYFIFKFLYIYLCFLNPSYTLYFPSHGMGMRGEVVTLLWLQLISVSKFLWVWAFTVLAVILLLKVIYFSYIMALKCKPTSSSGVNQTKSDLFRRWRKNWQCWT